MELLIVMAIILILMLIAIPTVGSLKKKANELSAIQSIRAIQQAEMQYRVHLPGQRLRLHADGPGRRSDAGAPRQPRRRFCKAT